MQDWRDRLQAELDPWHEEMEAHKVAGRRER